MPGLRQNDAEALVLNGLRTQLMQPAAYEKFRADLVAGVGFEPTTFRL
jgi:hypothetical protein